MQLFKPAIRVENPHQFGAERVILFEPTLPHTTFTPGVHLVETPIE
jgi:hypothetical protein